MLFFPPFPHISVSLYLSLSNYLSIIMFVRLSVRPFVRGVNLLLTLPRENFKREPAFFNKGRGRERERERERESETERERETEQ